MLVNNNSKATAYSQEEYNVKRTRFLIMFFLLIVIGLGWLVSYYTHNSMILYGAVIYSIIHSWFSYFNSDKVALKMTGARLADRNNPDELRLIRAVQNTAMTVGIPVPGIYVIHDPAPNAFATGRDKEHSSIAATIGLIQMMDKNELEGVIAHEMSHIKNRDILVMSVVVTMVGIIAIFSDILMRSSSLISRREDGKGNVIFMIAIFVFTVVIVPLVTKLIQMAVSRKREFMADAGAVQITRYPQGLASALEKISEYKRPMQNISTGTAHLFISDPYGNPEKVSFWDKMKRMFSTHPPIEERIKKLREMDNY